MKTPSKKRLLELIANWYFLMLEGFHDNRLKLAIPKIMREIENLKLSGR